VYILIDTSVGRELKALYDQTVGPACCPNSGMLPEQQLMADS
jgi:hypothetical protein